MLNKSIKERQEDYIAEWFEHHKATVENTGSVTKLLWRKPGTSTYSVVYLLYGGYLFVGGDIGEAVYRWSEVITLPFLAGCDLDYFGGKCQASSEEPKGKEWYPEKVEAWIQFRLKEWTEENPLPCPDCCSPNRMLTPEEMQNDDVCQTCKGSEIVDRSPITLKTCYELNHGLKEAISSAGAWADYIYNCDDGLIMSNDENAKLTYETYECSENWDTGYDWDLRTRGHLIGLKMAYTQLQRLQKENEVPCTT